MWAGSIKKALTLVTTLLGSVVVGSAVDPRAEDG